MFKINWEPFNKEFSETLKEKFNETIKNVELPDAIRHLKIEKLSLGSTKPVLEILDISSPFEWKTIEITDNDDNKSGKSEKSEKSRTTSIYSKSKQHKSSNILVETILKGNKFLKETQRIKIRVPREQITYYPPTHIHSKVLTNSVKKVLTSNLGEDENLLEKDLLDSLSFNNNDIGPNPNKETDIFEEGTMARVRFAYDGNANIELYAEICVDIPFMEDFIRFPVSLKISHLVIEGIIIAEFKNFELKISTERDKRGILKDFSMTVKFGDQNENQYIDKTHISSLISKCFKLWIKKNIEEPNSITINLKEKKNE